ncbi:COPI associated protein-domain-containing protein [Circinella umbellata]|nr:COPI associated protein-domain-containing protein [Circinella umbellata]
MPSVDISLVFRVINCVAAAFMAIGGVGTIIRGFNNFITGIFCIIFGLVTAVFEFRLPAQITQFASFMFSFLGRGISLNYGALAIAAGVIVILIGVVYCVLHFVPGVQAPTNMQRSAFEESLGYSTRPLDQGGAYPAGSSPAATYNSGSYNPPATDAARGTGGYDSGSFPTKTYVSDGPTV